MGQFDTNEPESLREAKLPWRDWILLPLLGMLTVGILAASTESISRHVFKAPKSNLSNCIVQNDPSTGPRNIPNTTCWESSEESPLVEYKFNSCGDRTGEECGPKPPGSYRIVMLGSSFPLGLRMRWESTFAALLPKALSKATRRKIDVYDEAGPGHPHQIVTRFNSILAVQPDIILWVLTPFDIETETLDFYTPIPRAENGKTARALFRMKEAFAERTFADAADYIWTRAMEPFENSATSLMAKHFLFESENQYVKACLFGGDSLGYIRVEQSAQWQSRLRMFESDDAAIERQAKAAGVPVVAVLVPNRPLAAITSLGKWPDGFDPYKLDDDVRSIVESHGGTYIDLLKYFHGIPNAEQYYLPIDGHPTAEGHAIIARLLAEELTSGAVPAFKVETASEHSETQQQTAPEHRR